MKSEAANRNIFWAELIVEELVRQGCEMFFISPGSRSTPLVFAVARHPKARSVLHFDERGSAFAALGYARVAGKPAVWITTSGTAVANGLPAVTEAHEDNVPMLLLTADRPPELRDTDANQTIDQPGIFGSRVRWFFDVPPPSDLLDPSFLLATVDQAICRAADGPVHLNCMFRKPLEPRTEPYVFSSAGARLSSWMKSEKPFTEYARSGSASAARGRTEKIVQLLGASRRPICILGRIQDVARAEAVVSWAEASDIPILPDIGCQVRLGASSALRIPYFDLILSNPKLAEDLEPDAIVQVGRTPVSISLLRFVRNAAAECSYILVSDGESRIDPVRSVSHRFVSDRSEFLIAAAPEYAGTAPGWCEKWISPSLQIESFLKKRYGTTGGNLLTEQGVVYRLADSLRSGSSLIVGNSLPVRHFDRFAAISGGRVRVIANRGASGIDGTIATAAGAATANGRPTTVLLGDLALLHDLNSLVLAARTGLVVVVLNNDGGGIFSHLPVSNYPEVCEPFFGTPHGYRFKDAARMFSLDYSAPETLDAFEEAYAGALGSAQGTLIEVAVKREDTLAETSAALDAIGKIFN